MLKLYSLRFPAIVLTLGLVMALFVACDSDDDGDSQPTTGTLNGTVIFHGDWPDSGTVQVSLFENWNNEGTGCWWCAMSAGGPPSYYTPSSHFQDPDPTNTSAADTLTFALTGITLGSYDVAVAGWRVPAASQTGNVECDEPVIGMYGAVAGTNDTIPDAITFSSNAATQAVEMHVWFQRTLPVAGCNDLGRIDGSINFTGTWPTGGSGGIAAIITTMPYTVWEPGGIAGYRGRSAITAQTTPTCSFSPPYGSYYVSFWTNEQPPNNRYLGAYGVFTNVSPIGPQDAASDMITLSADAPLASLPAMNLAAPAPHYVSGTVTFTGERPAVGLAVVLSPTPVLMGPPAGWYALDPTETVYALTGMADGTFYVLLYDNITNGSATLHGSYDADENGQADPLVFDGTTLGHLNINLSN